MTVRDSQRAIESGSVAHGDRAGLEAGLSQVLSQQEAAGGPTQGGGPPPLTIPEDPIGAMLTSGVGQSDLPSTDGLSVGPGAGAPSAVAPSMVTPRAEMLRDLAENAATPVIRQAARNELRRTLREGV